MSSCTNRDAVRSSFVGLGGWLMDLEHLGRVFARLRPFIRDQVVRRSRLERVLGTFGASADELRREVERLLGESGIAIEEDVPDAISDDIGLSSTDGRTTPVVDIDVPPDLAPVDRKAAVAAARRRLASDRNVRNHAKVLLRPEEEVGLAILVRGKLGLPLGQGDFGRLKGEARSAAECMLLHNQGLARSVALRYAPPGMSYDDVFHHGVIGLIRAVELFDPTRGYKFSTYAMNWVRQAITRGIANESRLIRLPVHMVERVNKVWATRTRLTVGGEPPRVHQLALACELTDEEILECLIIGPQHVLSLDMPIGADGESTLADVIDASDPDLAPDRELEFELMKEQIRAVLELLDEREAGVMALRYGLTDGEEKTLDEIGRVYGVTRERIRQIEGKTMAKLRHPSILEVLEPYLFGGGVRPAPEQEVEIDLTEE
jgi:RNA polymerase primary sigma factor